MKKSALAVVGLFVVGCVSPQTKALNWLEQDSVAITSLDSDDFRDLEPLKSVWKDKRIVMLGESSHGAAEFYKVKTRLAKFLVREMGFEVIAFESGVYECQAANSKVASADATYLTKKCLMWELFPTKEVEPLFEFVKSQRQSGRNVEIAGFDSEVSGFKGPTTNFEPLSRAEWFKSLIKLIDARYANEVFKLESTYVTSSGKEEVDQATNIAGYQKLVTFLEKDSARLKAKGSAKEDIETALQIARISGERLKIANSRDIRDVLMGKNIAWLLEKRFPGKKIILWAHNSHVGYQDIPFDKDLVRPSMVSYLRPKYGKEMYSVGLFMGEGTTHMWGKKDQPVMKPLPGSLEETFLKVPRAYSFMDFQHLEPSKEPGAVFYRPMKSYWWGGPEVDEFPIASQHDGIVFIRKVTPSSYL